MSRIYQHTLELLPQIKEMLAKGKTHKEIEETLGLVGDRPVNNLLRRERRKEKCGLSKSRGRKPTIGVSCAICTNWCSSLFYQ